MASRPAKVNGFDPAELHSHWTAEAHSAGFDPGRLTADRISHMTKIWHSGIALQQLGWA